MQNYKAKKRLTLQEDYNRVFFTYADWCGEEFEEEMAMITKELADIEADIKANVIKKYDAPTLLELEKIIEEIKIYKETAENEWYHSEVTLRIDSSQNRVFLSGNAIETEDELSESFLNYQNAVEYLTKENYSKIFPNYEDSYLENTDDYSEDAIGGVFLIYSYSTSL